MIGKAAVISLNFNPGHVSHMVASYRQCQEIGYDSVYYVNPMFKNFLPSEHEIVMSSDKLEKVDLAVFLFPSLGNIRLIRRLKKQGTKIIYVFHEPLLPLKEYRKAGFSYSYLAKLWVIDHVSALTVKWSDLILLPSHKAQEYYSANRRYKNDNAAYLPLLFDDERDEAIEKTERKYFSYIGTIAPDHSFDKFLEFVDWAVTNNRLLQMKFLIATKSEFTLPSNLLNSGRVDTIAGKPLSNDEINKAYASSWCVWNAYERTTQSGVLAKSFMFGTPAVILKKNENEFAEDNVEVVALTDNSDKERIEYALNLIFSHFEKFSADARRRFERSFYYKNYNNQVNKLINTKY